MAKVIEFIIETHIATENPAPDLNELIISLSDFISEWADKNASKHVYFDTEMEVARLSKKDYQTVETVTEWVNTVKREQELKKRFEDIAKKDQDDAKHAS